MNVAYTPKVDLFKVLLHNTYFKRRFMILTVSEFFIILTFLGLLELIFNILNIRTFCVWPICSVVTFVIFKSPSASPLVTSPNSSPSLQKFKFASTSPLPYTGGHDMIYQ